MQTAISSRPSLTARGSRWMASFTVSVITPSSSAAVVDGAPIGASGLESGRCGGNANCELLPHLLDRQPSTGWRGARAKGSRRASVQMFSSVPTARPRIAGLHAALAKMPLKRLVRPRQENAAGAPKKGVAEPGEEAAARQAVRDLDALPQFFESVAFLDPEHPTNPRPPSKAGKPIEIDDHALTREFRPLRSTRRVERKSTRLNSST